MSLLGEFANITARENIDLYSISISISLFDSDTFKPYKGKPSDMWALGVVLFTMLYGQFPFYDSVPQELFRKIKSAEFSIPK